MKKAILILPFVLLATQAARAETRKPCDELVREIAAKIEANGVTTYVLDTIEADASTDSQRIVGRCDGGTRRITYTRIDGSVKTRDPLASTR